MCRTMENLRNEECYFHKIPITTSFLGSFNINFQDKNVNKLSKAILIYSNSWLVVNFFMIFKTLVLNTKGAANDC